ncbi:MAG: hypothetical protein WAL32_06900 [Terriglobales bacterium]
MEPAASSYETLRRTTRVRAEVPVLIVSHDPGVSLSEHCQTVVVNCEGCGVRLTRPLEVGLRVSIEDLPGGLSAGARVTSCVALGGGGTNWLVGLELEQRGNIWSIRPAPTDWASGPAPSPVGFPAPSKKGEWPYSFFSGKGEAHPGRK